MAMIFFKKKKETKINDLIFKELIKRGYSLEGNTRVWNIADSKLWYLTPEQAQGYLDLEESEDYKKLTSNEGMKLVDTHIKEIMNEVGKGPINIIDLGCGDGKKAANIMKYLNGRNKMNYCPIDISGYMVQKAIETISKNGFGEIIESHWNISDFDNLANITPLLRKDEFKKSFFLLLGDTLGNFEVNELLYEIRSSMVEKDLLLIDTGIDNERWKMRAETAKYDEKTNKFFMHIPLLLGLEKEDIEFGARFENSRIEFYYIVKNDKNIKFQDKEVQLKKGDQIVVAIAYKHKKEDLLSYLNMHFDEVHLFVSKDNSKVLALCKR